MIPYLYRDVYSITRLDYPQRDAILLSFLCKTTLVKLGRNG